MLAPGDVAPAFSLLDLEGTPWTVSSASEGGLQLVAFIETDCPTCRLALPYVERLHQAIRSAPSQVVAISQDGADETRALASALELDLPVLLDDDLAVSRAFDPVSVPSLFLLDSAARVVLSSTGFDKKDINALAHRMLTHLGLPPKIIADPNDGAPSTKPGCSSRHRETLLDSSGVESPEPIDLRPPRGRRASRISLEDDGDPYDFCMTAGFSPFLPVVPPTEERVAAMLAATPLAPESVVGLIPPCYGAATVEKIAANGVMAGCPPALMEVLIPVVRAACDERFNLHGVQATTHSATPLIILSGPSAARLGFASGAGLFGNVARANSSVGRALQLIMTNLGGAAPGEIDMATLGSPGRFSFCIAEHHAASPWQPLHVEQGYAPHESSVTLFAAGGLTVVSEHTARSGRGLLSTISAALSVLWSWRVCGRVDALVVVCPEHAATLAADGFDKSAARQYLFDNTGVPLRAFEGDGQGTEGTQRTQSYHELLIGGEPHYRKFSAPEQIRIIVAGGAAGKFSGVLGGWLAGEGGSQAVTYPLSW